LPGQHDRLDDTKLYALLETLPLGVIVFRLEDRSRKESLRIVFANSQTEAMLGLAPSLLAGGPIADVFPNSLAAGGTAEMYRDAVVGGRPLDLGVISYGDDRVSERRFSVSAFPLGEDLVAVLYDNVSASADRVTELAAIVDSAEDAILSKSLDGTILTWNGAAERIYGYSPAEAIGRPISMLLPPDRPGEVAGILRRLRSGDRIAHFSTKRLRKDGVVIDVSLTISPIVDSRGTIVGAATIARDMGRQNEAEARAGLLAAIVESSEDAIISRTLDGTITSWNFGAERLFGYTAEEAIGESIDVILGTPTAAGLEARKLVNRGEYQAPLETTLTRKDGADVHASIAPSPIADSAGAVIGVASVIRDVTEQRRLEDQLRQAQKIEAIGSLAGGIAHDFNNVLTVIRNTSAIILNEAIAPGLEERVRQIDLAAEHAAALTRQLLAFSRVQVLRPEPTALNDVVEATLELVSRVIGAQIVIERDLSEDLDPILVDRSQLQQVILNLCINARDAMPDGGTLSLRTTPAILDEAYARENLDVEPGRYALLEVTDSGAGIDEETRNRIFDPFFTTKPEGTGLGLATVYGIVKQSGGHICVESEPGLGATFKVYLQPGDGPVRAPTPRPEPPAPAQGDATILVVEDSELLRPLIVETLEAYGYSVISAADGVEALAVAEAHVGPIDLLLTDVVMPRMNGREVADRLCEIRPELKVLFTSGYPADTVVRLGIEEGRFEFLQKPYLGEELLGKLRGVLGAGS
jgi:PAS domain S-box-containing protein